MLVLSSESSCDVCLEGYGGYTVPNIIVCGHSFCQRCLLSLNPMMCPLCRAPFLHHDIRRLHADRINTSTSSSEENVEIMDESSQARDHLRTIMRVINSGGTTDGVSDFLQEVRDWLNTQPSDAHPVLRAAHVLFWKYWHKKTELNHAEQLRDALKERLLAESELAEARYHELKQASEVEVETLKAVEQSLRDRLASTEKTWEEKYDVSLARCRALSEELQSLKEEKGHPDTPPRTPEAIWLSSADASRSSPLRVVDEEAVVEGMGDKEFTLSPVPRTRSIPTVPSTSFRGISYESDRDDEGNKSSLRRSTSPYTTRQSPSSTSSRTRSNSSLLSRPETEGISRSLPKSTSVPSPASSHSTSERHTDQRGAPFVVNDGLLGLRIGDSSATVEVGDADQEQRERWRSQLREVLDDSHTSRSNIFRRKTVSGTDSAHHVHPFSSSSTTRNPSPLSSSPPASSQNSVSTSPSSAAPVVTPPPAGPPRPQLISRASEAAIQAERARASAANSASTSPAIAMYPMPRERDAVYAYTLPHTLPRQTTPRRMSTESPKVRSPTATATASNLTRSLWASQDSHRPEPQRVS